MGTEPIYLPCREGVPPRWSLRALPEVAAINPETLTSRTPPDFRFRYIDITSVTSGFIDWNQVGWEEFRTAPSRARRVLRKDDALLCTVRPGLKSHAAIEAQHDDPLVCSTGFAVLRAKNGHSPRLLFHLLFSDIVARQLHALQMGTGYPAVNESDVGRVRLLLPDDPREQAEIAHVLDAVDVAIDRTRAALEKARKLRRALTQRLVRFGVAGFDTHQTPLGALPKHWEYRRLRDFIADGPTNGLYRPDSDYGHDGVPIVRIDSFNDGALFGIDRLLRVRLSQLEIRRWGLQRDDILINRVNSLSHIGKAAIVPAISEPTVFESNMMRLRLNADLLPQYLSVVLCSDIARAQWLARAKPAVNQASINQRDVRDCWVPKPPIPEQEAIAIVIQKATGLEERLQAISDQYARLKRGLMQKLLTGKVRVGSALSSKDEAAPRASGDFLSLDVRSVASKAADS